MAEDVDSEKSLKGRLVFFRKEMKVTLTRIKQRQWREMGRFDINLKAELTGPCLHIRCGTK